MFQTDSPLVSGHAGASSLLPEDPANEAMRILDNIKARPAQIAREGADPTAGAGGNRSYNLDYVPRSLSGECQMISVWGI
jgi:hypothetical protein